MLVVHAHVNLLVNSFASTQRKALTNWTVLRLIEYWFQLWHRTFLGGQKTQSSLIDESLYMGDTHLAIYALPRMESNAWRISKRLTDT